MMLGWSFSARSLDETARLVRALSKNRYVSEIDFKLHWAVDFALADLASFGPFAKAFEERRARDKQLEIQSRDPSLWRSVMLEDVVRVLEAFWTEGPARQRYVQRLKQALAQTGLPPASHEPFQSNPDDLPHPELVMLDWVYLPVDELDTERHAGALSAMEEAMEEVNPSAPVYVEGPVIAAPELCEGMKDGALCEDFFVWSDGPYSYSDYVFRGVSKAAKLPEPPLGYNDFNDE